MTRDCRNGTCVVHKPLQQVPSLAVMQHSSAPLFLFPFFCQIREWHLHRRQDIFQLPTHKCQVDLTYAIGGSLNKVKTLVQRRADLNEGPPLGALSQHGTIPHGSG
jgi:hypothetical protein